MTKYHDIDRKVYLFPIFEQQKQPMPLRVISDYLWIYLPKKEKFFKCPFVIFKVTTEAAIRVHLLLLDLANPFGTAHICVC